MSPRGYEGTHVQPAVKVEPAKKRTPPPREGPEAETAAEKRQRSTKERLEARAAERNRQRSARKRPEAAQGTGRTAAIPPETPAWIRRSLP